VLCRACRVTGDPSSFQRRNVAAAIKDDGLRYPVVQDNECATRNASGRALAGPPT
jgi:hypothetical protein